MVEAQVQGDAGRGSEASRAYERRWWILGVLCVSLLVVMLDNTVLNVALPTLVRDLHASTTQLQWIVDAYTLVFAGLLLTAGSLSDRFGRKLSLGTGLLVFGAGSVACAFAGSADILIATRAVMGLGAALIMPATLSILIHVFPPQERARAIGIWAGVSGLGIGLGPLIGGELLDHFWWGSVFLINVPIVLAALAAVRLIVPESKDPAASRTDAVGVLLSIVGIVSLIYAIVEAPNRGWTDSLILAMFAVAAVVLAVFVWWELRADRPMLDIRLFRNPRFGAANLSIVLVFFAMLGSLFLITQYLQFIHGYTPLEAGVRTAPIALIMMVFSPPAGQLVKRVGNKVLVATGMFIAALGLLLLSRLTAASTYAEFFGAMAVLGVGMAFAMTPATDSIMGAIPPERSGVGSALNDTTRELGGALGVAILGSIFASAYASRVTTAVTRLHVHATGATKSVGTALGIARGIGGPVGQQLASAASHSFIDAMSRALLVGSFVAFAGALVAAIWLPNRAPAPSWQGVGDRRMEYAGPSVAARPEPGPAY
ncbi:MAG TPA: MFS transporter [Acidimicrobiales bacterium]|nr:MFS transporter [Acidimicrobiales bacterium]